MYTYISNNNIICNLQFGFWQYYCKCHPLANINYSIRKALDYGNLGCWVFVDLQPFDIVDHQILLTKLRNYGICGVSNNWFQSCLSNHYQYVSINWYQSVLDVPQVSDLGPVLFLLYISNLYQEKNLYKVHHFANEATNLLCPSKFIKTLNKVVYADLKHVVNWLNASKISINVK